MSGDSQRPKLDIAKLDSTFKSLDQDGDGRVSVDDVRVYLLGVDQPLGEDIIRRHIGEADRDGGGVLDYLGFITVMTEQMRHRSLLRELENLFSMLDSDRDGYITTAELANMKAMIGEGASEQEIDEMIRVADQNGDGRVSYDEFLRLIIK